ncbi:AAA-ATPase [Phytophthora citrophthora]|uniref:AAA-ATPase n=1 Tax=Phytophthora citrophthora TaxID=4793 RepID=A0AAD9FYZ6_9STRA|nr:AAA-ATPase [Phytophthora citrophthora]
MENVATDPTDELLRNLSTGNVAIDAFVCLVVSLLLQQLITHLQGSSDSLLSRLYNLLFGEKEPEGVFRIIGITQRFSSEGHKIWDYDQKNHLLQKAISIYLADALDLTNKDAKYDLLHRPQKKTKTLADNDDGGTSESSFDSEEDDDTYCGAVDGLCWEALPQENEWIEVEEGIQFKHETVEPEDKEEQKTKSLTETNVNFKFFSTLPDGSERIDALIQRAFKQYQDTERQRYTKDTLRYYYIQTGGPSILDKDARVTYKRYALGEEKTFENLFFQEKDSVVQLLNNFTNKSGKFSIKGFPYKLGLLLHGPPGTGKTSLIKAIAQHTRRHIVTISLGKIRTNQQLLDALFDMSFAVQGLDSPVEMGFEDVVFVMEDIDCASSIVNTRDDGEKKPSKADRMFDSQKKAMEEDPEDGMAGLIGPMLKPKGVEDKLSLSGLLNVLDGVIDCPGRIVIMTTNHPEKLDPALVRPGRVNKKLLLGYMGCVHVQQMIEYYCVAKLDEVQVQRLREAFEVSSQLFTPAEIEELCAEHDDVDAVLGGFERLAAKN